MRESSASGARDIRMGPRQGTRDFLSSLRVGGKTGKGFPAALLLAALLAGSSASRLAWAQEGVPKPIPVPPPKSELETTEDWNKRLQELFRSADQAAPAVVPQEYRIGPEDLIEISVFEAPELNRAVRVSAGGEISLPLLGAVQAAGLTPRELEFVLEELLRRTYMKDPHVGVFIREMESHSVSVFGAVKKPGVFQVRGTKTLIEVLSLAEGLAEDAGDTVIVMRGGGYSGAQVLDRGDQAGTASAESSTSGQAEQDFVLSSSQEPSLAQETIEINLKDLLETGDPRHNIPVYPGDIVKVTRAGVVYVVGEVNKPGGFVLRTNEHISVLQAIALGEGLTRTAAKGQARIIRTDEESGERTEIPLDLGKVLAGKVPDPFLQPKDIVFVPNSAARSALYRGAEAAISIASGVLIWRGGRR